MGHTVRANGCTNGFWKIVVTQALRGAATAVFTFLLLTSAAAMAQSVAVVVNVEGKVQRTNDGTSARVTMLQLVSANETLVLTDGAKLVLLYMATGHEYSLLGPATARVGAASVAVLEGKDAVLRSPLIDKVVHLRPDRIVQAGMVMRNPPALEPGSSRASQQATSVEIELRRPALGASISERTVYGLWLEHVGAMIEARVVWRELAAERPEEAALVARAR